jgi:hypothetical protein
MSSLPVSSSRQPWARRRMSNLGIVTRCKRRLRRRERCWGADRIRAIAGYAPFLSGTSSGDYTSPVRPLDLLCDPESRRVTLVDDALRAAHDGIEPRGDDSRRAGWMLLRRLRREAAERDWRPSWRAPVVGRAGFGSLGGSRPLLRAVSKTVRPFAQRVGAAPALDLLEGNHAPSERPQAYVKDPPRCFECREMRPSFLDKMTQKAKADALGRTAGT